MESLDNTINTHDYDNKTNNEILLEMKQMEYDYEALKLKLQQDWDKLLEMERRYKIADWVLMKRLKG